MKNQLLYSDDLWGMYGSFDKAKESLKEVIMENKDYESEEEITDKDVFDQFGFDDEIFYEDFCNELNHYFNQLGDNRLIISAQLGRWNGTFEGGKILDDFEQIRSQIFSSYDNIIVSSKDNCLYIEGLHHDERDYFYVYQLTDKGEDYADRHYDEPDSILIPHLLNTKSYVKKIFSKISYLGEY